MSTHEYRRGIRRTGLLLGAAFVAITIAGLAVSKAQALAWGTAAKPATTPSVSADALAQGLPKSMVFLGGFTLAALAGCVRRRSRREADPRRSGRT